MRTARHYLAREIYRSAAVVLVALLGLFSFFALVDELDSLSSRFTLPALLYLQTLAIPSRLYELLPIGLLIGAILALAGLAQRNELTILRVSGVSSLRLLTTLWVISLPLVGGALALSEYITPIAEIRYSGANLLLRGKAGGGRLASGYWFKEPTVGDDASAGSNANSGTRGTRIINVQRLLANGHVQGVTLYEFQPGQQLLALSQAASGYFDGTHLVLEQVVQTRIAADATAALADININGHVDVGTGTDATTANAATGRLDVPIAQRQTLPRRSLATTLTPERLLARILTPERMTLLTLLDYIDYLHTNQLQADRQIVAIWRKLAYPFTLLVMMTIAAPIGLMQTRRGGVGAKVFVGILLGVGLYMLNQLAFNVGMLSRWPGWLTALGPNLLATLTALTTLTIMESRHRSRHGLPRGLFRKTLTTQRHTP